MQVSSNKMHNQLGTGIKSQKTKPSEIKQNKTSETMDVNLKMKTKAKEFQLKPTGLKHEQRRWILQQHFKEGQPEEKSFSPSADEHRRQ